MITPSYVVCAAAGLLIIAFCSADVRQRSVDVWSPAIDSNLMLRTDMTWQFGGKEQRGWMIYVPLIGSLLKLKDESDERLFAMTLASWQKTQRLPANGILENETWMKMISTWQSRRVRDRGYPLESELVIASSTDLYDPERPMELRQVERRTYDAFKAMFAEASAELGLTKSSKFLKIISAFRTREYQEQLRRQSPQAQRTTLALNSTHFTGRALDLYVGGEPVDSKDDNRMLQTRTPAYRWLAKNAGRFGFQPYFYEPWHWEYTE